MSSNCLPHQERRVSEKAAEEARIARDEEFHRRDEEFHSRGNQMSSEAIRLMRDEEFHRSTDLYVEQQRVQVMTFSDAYC